MASPLSNTLLCHGGIGKSTNPIEGGHRDGLAPIVPPRQRLSP